MKAIIGLLLSMIVLGGPSAMAAQMQSKFTSFAFLMAQPQATESESQIFPIADLPAERGPYCVKCSFYDVPQTFSWSENDGVPLSFAASEACRPVNGSGFHTSITPGAC
jgi:hypothetical protein